MDLILSYCQVNVLCGHKKYIWENTQLCQKLVHTLCWRFWFIQLIRNWKFYTNIFLKENCFWLVVIAFIVEGRLQQQKERGQIHGSNLFPQLQSRGHLQTGRIWGRGHRNTESPRKAAVVRVSRRAHLVPGCRQYLFFPLDSEERKIPPSIPKEKQLL